MTAIAAALLAYLLPELEEPEVPEPPDEPDEPLLMPEEPELSVVCFRHLPERYRDWPEGAVDTYQSRLQRALEVSGEAWVSVTTLRGRTFLRAGIVNYLSTERDVDRMVDALRRLSGDVRAELDLP